MPQTQENYTWAEFKTAVNDLLGVDADRDGIDTFKDRWLRQGLIQCQRTVPRYCNGHEAIYLPQDFVTEGYASRGVMPPDARLQDMWLCHIVTQENSAGKRVPTKGPHCTRHGMDRWPWADRFELVNRMAPIATGRGLYSIDPQGYTFYVYPQVWDFWMLSLWWEGLRIDFQDEAETPFDESLAGVIALFLKAQISREVNTDLNAFTSYMSDYDKQKKLLYAGAREKG